MRAPSAWRQGRPRRLVLGEDGPAPRGAPRLAGHQAARPARSSRRSRVVQATVAAGAPRGRPAPPPPGRASSAMSAGQAGAKRRGRSAHRSPRTPATCRRRRGSHRRRTRPRPAARCEASAPRVVEPLRPGRRGGRTRPSRRRRAMQRVRHEAPARSLRPKLVGALVAGGGELSRIAQSHSPTSIAALAQHSRPGCGRTTGGPAASRSRAPASAVSNAGPGIRLWTAPRLIRPAEARSRRDRAARRGRSRP